MVNIVIVDSGVELSHRVLEGCNISAIEYVNGEFIECSHDSFGHGTAVSGIVSNCNAETKITMIKIQGIEKGIEDVDLISVLNYIHDFETADIINLSLGVNVSENYDDLYKVCKDLSDKGTIIVSAFDNSGSISYPAAFDVVIGVVSGQNCLKASDYEYVDDSVVNICGKGNLQRVAWSKPEYLMMSGNSLACAHVTSKIAELISCGFKSKQAILTKFKDISINKYLPYKKDKLTKSKFFNIKKAVLFPFNKEIHSIVRYNDLLSFDIVDVYDSKYSAKIGATTNHLLNMHGSKNWTIKNIDNICWENFDTLILGHLNELSKLIKKDDYVKEIVDKAIEYNKNIYSFDDLSGWGFEVNSNIYFPRVDINDLPTYRFGMLYRISKPVVGVFGTSSRQGKFTLQLELRKQLSEYGYRIGQIGTEPSSLLYGMDYVFPMGYNSSVYLNEFDSIRYLNQMINNLCVCNNEIIIVGSQSGTVAYDMGNLLQYPISQYGFLMGTQPDCVILCVNSFDDLSYIERTIKFIENSIFSKVVALVVFPMGLKQDWTGIFGTRTRISDSQFTELKNRLFNHFHIPIYELGNKKDMKELVDIVLDYFAE